MHLKKLVIELQEWGTQKGQYEIEIIYAHERTETKMFLPTELTRGLLEMISKNIVDVSADTAKRLSTSLPSDIIQSAAPQLTEGEQ